MTVTAPPNPGDPFVNDPFNRTLASGLGTADVGGPWTVSAASGFGVGSGAGLWKLSTPGVTRSAYLGATLRDSTDLVLNLSADKNATGGTTFAHVEGRRVSANTVYRGVLRFTASNSLSVGIEALKGSATSTVLAAPVTVGSISPGTQIHVRMQTFGTNSTTIRAKVWLGAANEPAAWTVTVDRQLRSAPGAGRRRPGHLRLRRRDQHAGHGLGERHRRPADAVDRRNATCVDAEDHLGSGSGDEQLVEPHGVRRVGGRT